MFSSWYKCKFQCWLRYLMGYTSMEEKAQLKAGSAYHAAMAMWALGGKVSEAAHAFDEIYHDWAMEHFQKPDHRLDFTNVRATVVHWLQTHPLGEQPYEVLEVEVPFEVPLVPDSSIILYGRIDTKVRMRKIGSVYVKENKSTGSYLWGADDNWIKQWDLDAQLDCYTWAARQLWPEEHIGGTMVQALQFKKLPSSNRDCSKHHMKYTQCGILHYEERLAGPFLREQDDLEEWRTDALDAALAMQRLLAEAPTLESAPYIARPGKFNGSCRWCEFEGVCKDGRYPDLLRRSLVHSPWDPREHQLLRPSSLSRQAT